MMRGLTLALIAVACAGCGDGGDTPGRQTDLASDPRFAVEALYVDPDAPAETLVWSDLLPDGEVERLQALMEGARSNSLMGQFGQGDFDQITQVNVVQDLDGLIVRMPGFILPVDFMEAGSAREFLLLPYHGACIHYPPPPANQVVHLRSAEPIEFAQLWDPVWVEGRMMVETTDTQTAAAAYAMAVRSVEPYTGPG